MQQGNTIHKGRSPLNRKGIALWASLLAAKVTKTAAEAGSGPRLLVTAATSLNKELGYTKTCGFAHPQTSLFIFAKAKNRLAAVNKSSI